MKELVKKGRIPITDKNIDIIKLEPSVNPKTLINEKSRNAGLIMIGMREELVKRNKEEVFAGYEDIGTTLFVFSSGEKEIE